jgi:hypothetical protein
VIGRPKRLDHGEFVAAGGGAGRVVTVMWPVAAAVGTVVTIWLAVADTMVAAVPPNATAVAADRFWPVMVTVVPAAPAAG